MQIKGDSFVNKLILLFVFDKMEVPLSENTVLDMCSSSNSWISYMDCKPLLSTLLQHSFIYKVSTQGEPLYSITPDGRICLADFYVQIPSSLREEISLFVKKNRNKWHLPENMMWSFSNTSTWSNQTSDIKTNMASLFSSSSCFSFAEVFTDVLEGPPKKLIFP